MEKHLNSIKLEPKEEKFCESDDVIILGSSQMPRPMMVSHVKHKKRKKREVTLKESVNMEILVVTQKVEVKKRKNGCVINVNTNVTDSNVARGQQKCRKHCTKNICLERPPGKERVVPYCLRPKCRSAYPKIEDRKIKCNATKLQKEPRQKSSISRQELPRGLRQLVSPVSSPPLKNSLSYDDISLDSFHDYSETKLDTLIKRTREREKKLQPTKSAEPISTSTPYTERALEEIDHKDILCYTNGSRKGEKKSPKTTADAELFYDVVYSPIPCEHDADLQENNGYLQDRNAYLEDRNTYLEDRNAYSEDRGEEHYDFLKYEYDRSEFDEFGLNDVY